MLHNLTGDFGFAVVKLAVEERIFRFGKNFVGKAAENA
jgi:hypothetical protein